ncbi:hypothetical protein CEXT_190921 [Caerostris extrusa]|uniref:Uncharacterized protein n=1 Tax=Caerostris extrusa TaxID=172846 RepID=A0AAV4QHX8_CAEEX|nr:hypothetical protein CEXT_190921 [Caerostris extrusa]
MVSRDGGKPVVVCASQSQRTSCQFGSGAPLQSSPVGGPEEARIVLVVAAASALRLFTCQKPANTGPAPGSLLRCADLPFGYPLRTLQQEVKHAYGPSGQLLQALPPVRVPSIRQISGLRTWAMVAPARVPAAPQDMHYYRRNRGGHYMNRYNGREKKNLTFAQPPVRIRTTLAPQSIPGDPISILLQNSYASTGAWELTLHGYQGLQPTQLTNEGTTREGVPSTPLLNDSHRRSTVLNSSGSTLLFLIIVIYLYLIPMNP